MRCNLWDYVFAGNREALGIQVRVKCIRNLFHFEFNLSNIYSIFYKNWLIGYTEDWSSELLLV